MGLFGRVVDLLDYPTPRLGAQVRACLALAPPAPAARLQTFLDFVDGSTAGALEELYTGTFDLQAACPPYVGFHLFGEDWRRSAFMAELSRRYRERGLATAPELPDHLCQLLRYLDAGPPADEADELVRECLIPAVATMQARLEATNPYATVLEAVAALLATAVPAAPRKER
jgi:nitrate reductase molybdenum cofactor assembly chaperone NarJ/NarW